MVLVLPPKENPWANLFGAAANTFAQGYINDSYQQRNQARNMNAVQNYFNAPDQVGQIKALYGMDPESRKSFLEYQNYQKQHEVPSYIQGLFDPQTSYDTYQSSQNFEPQETPVGYQGFQYDFTPENLPQGSIKGTAESPLQNLLANYDLEDEVLPVRLEQTPQQMRQQALEEENEDFDVNYAPPPPNAPPTQNAARRQIFNPEQRMIAKAWASASKNPNAKFAASIANTEEEREKEENRIAQKQAIADERNVLKKNELDAKERRKIHEESKNFDEEILKQARNSRGQLQSVRNIKKALQSGNVKPTKLASVFKNMGHIGDKISEGFRNKDQATIDAELPRLFEGWKDVFGIRLTDADLRLLMDKMPTITKSVEANMAVANVIEKYAELGSLREQIGNDIKKENKGYRPLNYASQVESRYGELTQPVEIINPNTGNVIEIPAYKLSDALKAGAKLANE